MITIERLDVEFVVDGDDDAVFERLFRRHIERWSRDERYREQSRRRLEHDRSVHRAEDDR